MCHAQPEQPYLLLDYRTCQLNLAERGADLDAGDAVGDAGDGLAGDGDAFFKLVVSGFALGHAVKNGVGNHDAGNLVVHEHGVAVAGKRPDAGKNRNAVMLHLVQHDQQGVRIEDRLRNGELGAGVHLLGKTLQLVRLVEPPSGPGPRQ